MNLEEMFTILRGASGGDGAKFDVVQKWFIISKIINERINNITFSQAYERLCPNGEELNLVKFIQLMGILSRESRQDLKGLIDRFETVRQQIINEILCDKRNESEGESVMEDAFEKLRKEQRNSVENLIKWMKDSKIVDGVKVTEDKARQLFSEVSDVKNVELAKFQEAIAKLAAEQQKTVEEFSRTLAAEGDRFMNAVFSAAGTAAEAAAKALKENLRTK